MEPHAWNIVRVNGVYYHIDATWDINHYHQTNEYSYEYFCVNDDSINTDHNWDINTTPACNYEDLSFYIKSGCYANTLSQIDEIFTRYAKSKTQVVRLRVSDNEEKIIRISHKGEGEITAADIETDGTVEVLNKELQIELLSLSQAIHFLPKS